MKPSNKATASEDCETATQIGCAGGRRAAGEDPAKREQILDGAKIVFLKMGFDAASMNDVVREAGVSKGTIYVYFQNKEDLFASLIEREKQNFVTSAREVLSAANSIESGLFNLGVTFSTHMMKSDVIHAMRTVLGVIDRMPGLSKRFFNSPSNVKVILKEYLDKQIAVGALLIDDSDLAARQFIEMTSGTFFKLRLFGELDSLPSPAEIERIVESGVRVFMAAYGPKTADAA